MNFKTLSHGALLTLVTSLVPAFASNALASINIPHAPVALHAGGPQACNGGFALALERKDLVAMGVMIGLVAAAYAGRKAMKRER